MPKLTVGKHIRYDTISQQEMQVIVYSANCLSTTRHAKFSCSRLQDSAQSYFQRHVKTWRKGTCTGGCGAAEIR